MFTAIGSSGTAQEEVLFPRDQEKVLFPGDKLPFMIKRKGVNTLVFLAPKGEGEKQG